MFKICRPLKIVLQLLAAIIIKGLFNQDWHAQVAAAEQAAWERRSCRGVCRPLCVWQHRESQSLLCRVKIGMRLQQVLLLDRCSCLQPHCRHSGAACHTCSLVPHCLQSPQSAADGAASLLPPLDTTALREAVLHPRRAAAPWLQRLEGAAAQAGVTLAQLGQGLAGLAAVLAFTALFAVVRWASGGRPDWGEGLCFRVCCSCCCKGGWAMVHFGRFLSTAGQYWQQAGITSVQLQGRVCLQLSSAVPPAGMGRIGGERPPPLHRLHSSSEETTACLQASLCPCCKWLWQQCLACRLVCLQGMFSSIQLWLTGKAATACITPMGGAIPCTALPAQYGCKGFPADVAAMG